VYRITPAGAFTQLYNFAGNFFGSSTNFYGLVQASDGNLYGVTPSGGANGGGTKLPAAKRWPWGLLIREHQHGLQNEHTDPSGSRTFVPECF
jgi:hypothetical protein